MISSFHFYGGSRKKAHPYLRMRLENQFGKS